MALEAVENVVRVYDFFEGREEVDFDRLSKIYLDHSTSPSHQLRSRNPGELRRPILIDGLDLMKGVSGRVSDHLLIQPLLKAFFYFIARGHRTIACIPEFYRNKSDNAEALNALVQLGLIEWVPCGNIYGCSRPTMDRHLVTGAKKTSGCIVSRAQMSDLRQLWPHLAEIVEKRLLMPSWVRGEMMLPADGPQGRFGASLEATLITTTSDNLCGQFQLVGLQQLRLLRAFAHPQLLGDDVDGRLSVVLAEELRCMLPESESSKVESFTVHYENGSSQRRAATFGEGAIRQSVKRFADERVCRQRQMDTVNMISHAQVSSDSAFASSLAGSTVDAKSLDGRALKFVDWSRYASQPSTFASLPLSSASQQKRLEHRSLSNGSTSLTVHQQRQQRHHLQHQEQQRTKNGYGAKMVESFPQWPAMDNDAGFGTRQVPEKSALSANSAVVFFKPKYAFFEELCEVVGVNKAERVISDHPDIFDLEELIILALNYD